jgi:hypothetical protein
MIFYDAVWIRGDNNNGVLPTQTSISQYILVCTSIYYYILVHTSTYWYVLVYSMLYLWVARMKAPLWHIKWITSGTHRASEQVGLPLHTTKRGQFSVNYMVVEDAVELCCYPTRPWLSPFISFVGKSQLFLEITMY